MALVVGENSYVDVATCTAYMLDRLFTDAWTAATPGEQAAALIMATRAIDRHLIIGVQKDPSQPLQFPRRYPFQLHSLWKKWYGKYIQKNEWTPVYMEAMSWWVEENVPSLVTDATCEEALTLLDRGGSSRLRIQRSGVTSMGIGGANESYAPGSGKGLLSQEAKELMRRYFLKGVAIT